MSLHITAEIGTTGELATLPLAGNLTDDVAAAVEYEHPCDGEDGGCDIFAALDNGYPLTAGYLLSGATETPLLDAVYAHYAADPFHAWRNVEATAWSGYMLQHARECRNCGGYTFGDDRWRLTTCANCRRALTVELRDLDAFTTAYAGTALWSSTDDDGAPLEANFTLADLAQDTLRTFCEDCDGFRRDVDQNFGEYILTTYGQDNVAHNFWLTRNGHGAGFWDGGFGEHGDALTKAAKAYGDCDLYVGDDGCIYS